MLDKSLAREQLWTLLQDKQITPACHVVGQALLRRFVDKRGDAWPSLEAVANYAGVSVRTVSRAISRLKEVGWLSWRQRRDTWCRNLTNAYRVLAAAVRAPATKEENTKRGFSATVSNGSGGKLLGGVFAALESRIMASGAPGAPLETVPPRRGGLG